MSSGFEILPERNEEYGTQEYWYVCRISQPFYLMSIGIADISSEIHVPEYFTIDRLNLLLQREEDGASFDWFKTYNDIAPLIEDILSKDHRILMLGCGNSKLSEDVWINHPPSYSVSCFLSDVG
jgi:hypothetical protein